MSENAWTYVRELSRKNMRTQTALIKYQKKQIAQQYGTPFEVEYQHCDRSHLERLDGAVKSSTR